MARPRKEGMDYFPHDVNLSTDKKVEALRIIHGNDGYVFYCITLENIYQEPNFELDVSDAETIQILAKKVEVTTQKLHEMILTSVKHGCFDRERYEEDQVLTSNGIKKRASVVVDKRVKMREKSRSGAVPDVSLPVSSLVSDAETGVESTQSKSKSKVKVNKDIKDNTFDAYTTNTGLIESLKSFIEFRKKIKKPMTDQAIKLLLGKLDKLATSDTDKITILEQSILNGWQGIFDLRNKQSTSNSSYSGQRSNNNNNGKGWSGKGTIPITDNSDGVIATEEEMSEYLQKAREIKERKERERSEGTQRY